MTEQSSNRCYHQIFSIPFFSRENPGIAYASDVAFFQKAFRRPLRFFRFFLSSPLSCKCLFQFI